MPMTVRTPISPTLDYRAGQAVPAWVRGLSTHTWPWARGRDECGCVEVHVMGAIATMPYKDPKTDAFVRSNGDFRLRIVSSYEVDPAKPLQPA